VLVERGLPPAPEKVAQVADDLSSSAEDVLADLRGMVVELRPATGADRGLPSALRDLTETTGARTGMEVTLDVQDPADELDRQDADLLEDVYRIIAEAVHNSVKHAEAATVRIHLSVTSHGRRRRLVATVTDDGCGIRDGSPGGAERPVSTGFGMTAMRERAARWGGVVRVRDTPGGGTRVQLTLPLLTSLPTATADRGSRRS
jgi:signal transduction histidine kinase